MNKKSGSYNPAFCLTNTKLNNYEKNRCFFIKYFIGYPILLTHVLCSNFVRIKRYIVNIFF
ncbi:MAG: hypothetical protein FD155_602 [Bacteroidetes bacterium]|nr:MAG: hypothetical protein FD155_602 [Bacteroidota bacterium]